MFDNAVWESKLANIFKMSKEAPLSNIVEKGYFQIKCVCMNSASFQGCENSLKYE